MVALDDVSLNIRKGEIHCLAGENGSGKSTLIKVMSGVYQPNGGEIWIDGKPVGKLSPIESIDHGIQVIYQDFSLFGNLTVAENLAMNVQLREKKKILNWKRVRQIATEAVHRLGVNLDLDTEVEKLHTAGKQLVAIARALMSDARLIIMDEPTTALTGKEVETLFRIVRDIQARGIAILFVSHKMREMLEISEHITVIRNGSKVADGPTSDFDEALITRHMTGTDITTEPYVWAAPADTTTTPPRIEARGLTVDGHFEDIDLNIHAGEIVGLSGLLGSGRTELVLALFGMLPGYQGQILVDKMIAEMQIATTSGKKMVNELSGGNQQRVVLARWLLTDARVLILNGPTVGVDVGSKAEIHRKIRELSVQKGLAVLMISDDVPELIQNCNRIIMMHRGRFTDEMACAETSDGQISSLLRTLK